MPPELSGEAWPRTVYDTDEWVQAWSRSTMEQLRADPADTLPFYLMERSPYWAGYEFEAEMEQIWDRPTVVLGSLYAGYGPAYLSSERSQVAAALTRGMDLVEQWKAAGLLVLNLPAEAAAVWESERRPEVTGRFDTAYYKRIGEPPDGILGDIGTKKRVNWKRYWRRTAEQGVRVAEDFEPSEAHIAEFCALANGSAIRHGWPVLYDHHTIRELVRVPGTRLIRADWHGRTLGGFVALEHDRRLYLWAGGRDPDVRQVSPYLFLLYEIMSSAADRGWDVIEFGKGNYDFKRRYGFGAINLMSLWYAATPEDADVHVPRLTTMLDGLAVAHGVS